LPPVGVSASSEQLRVNLELIYCSKGRGNRSFHRYLYQTLFQPVHVTV